LTCSDCEASCYQSDSALEISAGLWAIQAVQNTLKTRSMKPTFVLILACLLLSSAFPQDGVPSSEPAKFKLTPVAEDTFQSDTRSAYEVSGGTSWEKGRLSLAKGASITREINGGAWAQIRLNLNQSPPATSNTPAELRLWFVLNGQTNCFVRLRQEFRNETAVSAVAVIDTGLQDEQTVEQLIREASFEDNELQDLTITYRYGMIKVVSADRHLLSALIANGPAEVAAINLEAASGTVGITRLSVSSSRPAATLNESQKRLAAKATAMNHDLIERYQAGEYAAAAKIGERVLELRWKALGELHPDYAVSLNNLAHMYDRMGDAGQAEPIIVRAVDIYKTLLGEQHPEYALSLNNLALLYEKAGYYERAKPLFSRALQINSFVLGDESPSVATGLNNLAVLYYRTGDFRQAETFYQQALELNREVRGTDHPEYAAGLNNLALLYSDMRDYEKARPLCLQAVELRRKLLGQKHPEFAESLNNLALLLQNSGEYKKAKPVFMQAMTIWKETLGDQHPNYALSLNNLAVLHSQMGDSIGAEMFHRQASEIWKSALGPQHPQYALSKLNLALLYQERADHSAAEPILIQALEAQRNLLDNNSFVQSERQQTRNQTSLRKYLDCRLQNALMREADAIRPLEDLWQWKGAVTSRQQTYRSVASNPDLSPLFAELQTISRQLSSLSESAPIPLPHKAPELQRTARRQERADWESRFAMLVRQREDLEQRIAGESREFRIAHERLETSTVQQWLPADTALLDFLEYRHAIIDPEHPGKPRYERRFIVFVVRTDRDPVMLGLGPSALLAEAITEFRRGFDTEVSATSAREAVDSAGEQIRRSLWWPIEQHLDGVKTVIISPDTVLGTLPFAALPGKQRDTYLLEDYRIAMIPATDQLRQLMTVNDALPVNHGMLILGDVDYDAKRDAQNATIAEPLVMAAHDSGFDVGRLRSGQRLRWDALPGFREELNQVAALFADHHSGQTATVLSGQQADETTFLTQAPQFRFLHLITHGYFEDPNVRSISQVDPPSNALPGQSPRHDPFVSTYLPGLLCGLAMAGANHPMADSSNPQDGILRASEIEAASMLGVDLVVLSACETGLGAVAGGEGLTGLQRAFHISGARSVVASLWKVDDRATHELMKRFYTNLWMKKMAKVDALRDAQLWMLRHPDELEQMGVRDAAARGLGGRTQRVDTTNDPRGKTLRTDPYFWAAFQLSGEWK